MAHHPPAAEPPTTTTTIADDARALGAIARVLDRVGCAVPVDVAVRAAGLSDAEWSRAMRDDPTLASAVLRAEACAEESLCVAAYRDALATPQRAVALMRVRWPEWYGPRAVLPAAPVAHEERPLRVAVVEAAERATDGVGDGTATLRAH